MYKRLLICLAMAILLSILFPNTYRSCAFAVTQAEINWGENSITRSVSIVRNHLLNEATDDVKKELSTISFIIDKSPIPSAYAISIYGNKEIHFTSELYLLLAYLEEINILNSITKNKYGQCSIEYSEYVKNYFNELRTKLLQNKTVNLIIPPEEFALQYGGPCSSLADYYPLSIEIRGIREHNVHLAVYFLFLHELAHHILNHNALILEHNHKMNKSEFLSKMSFSQQQELAADAWAVNQLFILGEEKVIFSSTLWSLFISNSGIDLSLEPIDTHPTGVTRIKAVFNMYKQEMHKRQKILPPDEENLINDFMKLYSKIEDKLGPLPELKQQSNH